MKFLVVALIAVIGQTSTASCLGEAQIIAKVENVSKSQTGCVAQVSGYSIEQYNSSLVCPLDIDDVLVQGIEVGLVNGQECRLKIGDVLTGILVQTSAGTIVLE